MKSDRRKTGINRLSQINPYPSSVSPGKKTSPGDEKYLEYASDQTRVDYKTADEAGDEARKDAILFNVVKKYKPAVEDLKHLGFFDLIDQLAKCEIEPENSSMDTTQGGRLKKKGGVGEPKTVPVPVRVDKFAPLATALGKTAVEAHAYFFSFENVTKAIPITAIALANPSTTAIIFNAAKAALGFAANMCLTNAGITAISLAVLACLYDVKFDINILKFNDEDKKTILDLREQLHKNLKPSSKQFGTVAPTPKSVLDKIAKLQAEEAAKAKAIAAAIAADSESEKKALILSDKSNEGTLIDKLNTISNEAGDSAMPTAAPPSTPTASSGGRNTKKRGLKKLKKTRRGIRKPRFKY